MDRFKQRLFKIFVHMDLSETKFMPSYHGIEVDYPAMFDFLSQVPMKAIDHKKSVSLVTDLLAEDKEPDFQLRLAR